MKNNRIVNAYDTINPTREQKNRMLAAILKEADFAEKPVYPPKQKRQKGPIVYTAKPTKISKKSTIGAIAASLAIFVVSAAVLVQMIHQPEVLSYAPPTQPTLASEHIEPELVFPAEPTHHGMYNVIISEYAGCLKGTLENPTLIPRELQEFIDSRDTSGLGWIVYDVNGDGIEELLISDGELIYQAMTMDEDGGGCPILFTITEEEQYYRCQDGIFCRVSDYGSDYVQYDFFELGKVYPVLTEILEVVICDKGEYRIGKTEEKAVPVDESTAQWTLGEKYLRERLYVTPFLEKKQDGPAKNLTGVAAYDEIIQRYYEAVEEDWDTASLYRNGLPGEIAEKRAYGILGWCLLDIDGNGQEELLISDGQTIYDSYTVTASEELAPLMVTSLEKTVTLCQNGIFKAVYPNEGRTVYSYYKVTDEFTIPEKTIVYANGEYRAGQTEERSQPISKDEAGRIMSEYIELELFVTRFIPRDPDVYDTDGTYAEILQLYRKALTEKWTPSQCMDHGISMLISGYAENPGDIGYTFLNLDGGEEELIITDGTVMLGLYTAADGVVTKVLTSEARISYTLTRDNLIFHRGSGGAALTYYDLYKMEHPNVSQESGLVVVESYLYDAAKDPRNPWFFAGDADTVEKPCGDFDAEARTEELMNDCQQLNFRRFN